jgi:hypothetical protein
LQGKLIHEGTFDHAFQQDVLHQYS